MAKLQATRNFDETPPELRVRCRAWAAEVLQVEQESDRDAINRAFFKRIQESGPLPPADLTAAFFHLRDAEEEEIVPEIPGEFLAAAESQLAEKINSFAETMFDLAPEPRGSRWQCLCDQAAGLPKAAARLDMLVAGLALDLESIHPADEDARICARHLCRLLAADLFDKPIWRGRIRDLWRDDPERAGRAAKHLQTNHADFAGLDPLLIQELINAPRMSRITEFKAVPFEYSVPRRGPRAGSVPRSSTNGLSPAVWIIIIVCISSLGRLSQMTQPRRDEPPQPPFQERMEKTQRHVRELEERLRKEGALQPGEDLLDLPRLLRERQALDKGASFELPKDPLTLDPDLPRLSPVEGINGPAHAP